MIASLGGDEVAVVHRAGDGHVGLNGRLDCVRSGDGGRSWEEPVVMIDSDRDDRNPAFGVAPNGTLVVGYQYQGSYDADGKFDSEIANATDTRVIFNPATAVATGSMMRRSVSRR